MANDKETFDILDMMRDRLPAIKTKPSEITLVDWADLWLECYCMQIKDSTKASYKSAVDNHIKRVFRERKLKAITPDLVQLFVISLAEGVCLEQPLSPKTIKNIHGVLHKCLQKACELKYITENPASNTELPKPPHLDIMPMNTEQLEQFLGAIKGHPYEIVYKLAVFTGMRQSELIGLTWDCFNFENGTIHLYRQLSLDSKTREFYFAPLKNNKSRTLFPARAVMDMMQRQRQNAVNEFVFPGKKHQHLTHAAIRNAFKGIVEKLGYPHFRFHDLRHTYAVISLQANVDIKTLSYSMGHYSVAFTLDVYGFCLDEMKREGAEKMQRFIDKQYNNL